METLSAVQIFIATSLRMATPIALGAIAATLSERGGVINIGLEGMMLMGAFTGAAVSYFSGSAWVGLVAGVFAGTLMGALLGLLCIYVNANQIVVGIGVNILGLGASSLGLIQVWGNRGTSGWLAGLPHLDIPLVGQIPFIGQILNGFDPTVYLCLIVAIVAHVLLFYTPMGLWLRASGEHPTAVQTVGLNVFRIRFVGVLISGTLCGLAGVSLSLGAVNIFSHNMTAGRGFLAFAANMFGQWQPIGSFAASLLFGVTEAARMGMQGSQIPPQFLQMFPYLATVLVLAIAGRKARSPAALGADYPYPLSRRPTRERRRQRSKL